jgi:hypothetical protein
VIHLFGIVGTALAAVAIYYTCAAFVCMELNTEEHHPWCPLCQLRRTIDVAREMGSRPRKIRRFRRSVSRRNPNAR